MTAAFAPTKIAKVLVEARELVQIRKDSVTYTGDDEEDDVVADLVAIIEHLQTENADLTASVLLANECRECSEDRPQLCEPCQLAELARDE